MTVGKSKFLAYRIRAVREGFPQTICHPSPVTVILFSLCKGNTFLREIQIFRQKKNQNSKTID